MAIKHEGSAFDRPYIVNLALRRSSGDWAWVWFQCSSNAERAEVDAWLVATAHPLAFEAGTQQDRFRRIVEEIQGQAQTETDGHHLDADLAVNEDFND